MFAPECINFFKCHTQYQKTIDHDNGNSHDQYYRYIIVFYSLQNKELPHWRRIKKYIGKYETFALYLEDPEMSQQYLNTCIEETVRAGFDRKKAVQIERDNICAYFQRFEDKGVLRKISALLEKNGC